MALPTYAHFPGDTCFAGQTCGGCHSLAIGKTHRGAKEDVRWCHTAQSFAQVKDASDGIKPGGVGKLPPETPACKYWTPRERHSRPTTSEE